jgi:hypothetical protein
MTSNGDVVKRPDAHHPHRHSIEDLNPNAVLDKMASDKDSADPDLEAEFFEKFERRNWTLSLFEEYGRWAIRINPLSFGLSVILIWGFAVCCLQLCSCAHNTCYNCPLEIQCPLSCGQNSANSLCTPFSMPRSCPMNMTSVHIHSWQLQARKLWAKLWANALPRHRTAMPQRHCIALPHNAGIQWQRTV